MTVFEVLSWTTNYLKEHRIENPRLNAELLLGHGLRLSRERLYMHLQDPVGEKEREVLGELIERRILGEPLQYILGRQEFWSIDFRVDPRVLIPRPETEILVEEARSILLEMGLNRTPFVLEIGTGSGAVAISLAREVRNLFLVAADISKDALLLAKENARGADVLDQMALVNGDLFGPYRLLGRGGPFDMILSNPPYIGRYEIEGLAREVKDYEPTIALDGGEDGLDFYRRIASQGPSYLRKGGWLLLEVGQGQAENVSELIERSGFFSEPKLVPDLSGIARVVKAQKTGKIVRSTKCDIRNKFK
jgi:release factor glutamine methyltransferase